MPSTYDVLRKFYKSDRWKIARAMRIAKAGGRCENCGAVGSEVHHKKHLTPENVNNPKIAISQENLILLCNACHNKEHERFTSKKEYYFDADGNLIKRTPPHQEN